MQTKGFHITRSPRKFVSLDKLAVLSLRLDADNYETDEELNKVRESRGYSYVDFYEVCPEKLPNYEENIKNFFEEHVHSDEEICYPVAGSGQFLFSNDVLPFLVFDKCFCNL
ncbi:1,2-dihydroxy-3-keto-5-methylthiopentene dioxygenase 2 [Artemisia annua]|uniref:acireductone dioxygenase (Fe(2+)-requiring) n=1 Tax=Artemisia annua TaxID=35608 RepID=A0A2U1Q4U7_ARTAN|nr:1,2-dihydroxy-3-keto-5-methylthiopentene dioxygenase 2 [Artemisia annua]